MCAIKPQERPQQIEKQRRPRKPMVIIGIFLLLIAGGGAVYANKPKAINEQSIEKSTINKNNSIQVKTPTGTFKTFTGQQFHDLYNSFVYPNTAPIDESTPITGNEVADARIRAVAIKRGYQQRSAPVTDAFIEVLPGFKLQQRAAQPWLDMVAAAKKDDVNLGLTAAYRSAEDQRQIFIERMTASGVTPDMIATGMYDSQVSTLLAMTAIPGYSRHHTGYTIDIACEDQPTTSFEYTTCFKWLNANNYQHTKEHGWIPSYPPGSGNQGPEPESWEYVWVGLPPLTQ